MPRRLNIVLPAYNEAGNIAATIHSLMDSGISVDSGITVTVVDDGSTDGTGSICEQLRGQYPRLFLIHHPANRGYGAALISGFRAVESEFIAIMDSDGQFEAHDLLRLFDCARDWDVVAGYRRPRADPWARRMLGALWTRIGRLFFSVPLKDLNCGLKIIRRCVLADVSFQCHGPGINLDIMSQLVAAGVRIRQLPCRHLPRTCGKQTGGGRRAVLQALAELAQLWRRQRRARRSARGAPAP